MKVLSNVTDQHISEIHIYMGDKYEASDWEPGTNSPIFNLWKMKEAATQSCPRWILH